MMSPGAKRSSTSPAKRRVLPRAERRLRSSFPEVWAWYELLVTARAAAAALRENEEAEMAPRRSSARR